MNDEKQNGEAKEKEKGGGCMIKGFVQGQTLKLAQTRVVADTIDYLIAKFQFQGEDWRGLEKWMHLQQGERLYVIKLTNDRTKKSDHLNLGAGEWAVWLHGNENVNGSVTQRITTNICAFTVERSGALEGDAMPELPASVAEQLDARINAIERQDGTLPVIGEADEGKVLTVVSGAWQAAKAPVGGGSITVDAELSAESENPVQNKVITQTMNEFAEGVANALANVSSATPTFDLVALDLPTVGVNNSQFVETDTTEIMAALDRGPARFIFSVNIGVTVQASVVVSSMSAAGAYLCTSTPLFNDLYLLVFMVEEGRIQVTFLSLGDKQLPQVSASDEGKLLQVVGGAWSSVSVADSSIKTYIDDYINEALGGDY